MPEILIAGLSLVVILLALSLKNTRRKAEKEVFDLFMRGAYQTRLDWFSHLNPLSEGPITVLLGDSLIQEFPAAEMLSGVSVLNRGIGGDTTDNLMKRLPVTFKDLDAARCIILIGTNDLAGPAFSAEKTATNIRTIAAALKKDHPSMRIDVFSLLPVCETARPHIDKKTVSPRTNRAIRAVNRLLEMKSGDYTFHDIHGLFTGDGGDLRPSLTREGLHLSPEGYDVLAGYLRSILK